MKKELQDKFEKIKLLVLDVDGVLTDGYINIDADGKELKNFDVQDGFGIVLFRNAGLKTAIISARSTPAVTARAKDLKIDRVYQDAHPKLNALNELLSDLNIQKSETCFIGDDLPDIGVIKAAGIGVAVANASDEAKKVADYVTEKHGGRGAVREIVEIILKAQGKWRGILEDYS